MRLLVTIFAVKRERDPLQSIQVFRLRQTDYKPSTGIIECGSEVRGFEAVILIRETWCARQLLVENEVPDLDFNRLVTLPTPCFQPYRSCRALINRCQVRTACLHDAEDRPLCTRVIPGAKPARLAP